MSGTKPENRYIHRVGKRLPAWVYAEKTNNIYRAGTPDMYYEGPGAIMWVEYKWSPRVPKKIDFSTASAPHITKLQSKWLERAFKNNVPVALILGTPDGGLIFPGLSFIGIHAVEANQLKDPQQVADWIVSGVL